MNGLEEQIALLRNKIHDREDNKIEYMSDIKNWLCVHTTEYEPEVCTDGRRSIQTTAMVTDNELPRATVHVTLNQIVASNTGGNWDKASIVILAPYKDVVALNSNPQEVATEDTYFIPDPDKGLVLPDSTYIVRGDPNCKQLFEIGENKATYKAGNYSDEEIEKILSLDENRKYKYEQLLNCDVSDNLAAELLGFDSKLIKIYQNTKDKKAFLSGVLAEDKFAILNKILRDAVVKMSMEKMGYRYVLAHEDEISGKVAEIANEKGIRGQSGNKGHSCSPEAALEDNGCYLATLVKTLEGGNIDQIYEYVTNPNLPMGQEIISSILNDVPVQNAYKTYGQTFNDYINCSIDLIKCQNYTISTEDQKEIKRLEVIGKRGIAGYNSYLDTVLRRQAQKMDVKYSAALQKLKENPKDYAALKRRLNEYEINKTLSNRRTEKCYT